MPTPHLLFLERLVEAMPVSFISRPSLADDINGEGWVMYQCSRTKWRSGVGMDDGAGLPAELPKLD